MLFTAEFWVLVAFVIFIGILVYFGVPATILGALDSRTKRVSDELAEAQRLREEAARLLKDYEQKRLAAEREAADIVAAAREEAERLAGAERVRVWRLYLRAARRGFETGFTSIYQVRATRPRPTRAAGRA